MLNTLMNINGNWVDQRNSSWNAPYTFSGKEKDTETGYGYFGARYYDSGLSMWLSVDPMSDKYPSMSPYNYCANNPVMLVDPDGRTIVIGSLIYAVGMTSSNTGFEEKVVNALTNLCNNSTLAKSMITYLAENTDYTLNIIESYKGYYEGNSLSHTEGNPYFDKATSGTIGLTSEGAYLPEQQGGRFSYTNKAVRRFEISLIHEIAHAYHHAFGDLLFGVTTYQKLFSVFYLLTREVQATNDENTVRSEMKIPLRTHYETTSNSYDGQGSGAFLLDIDNNGQYVKSSDPNNSNIFYYKK